jgi:DNA-binding HxlR family transcriptional regulator
MLILKPLVECSNEELIENVKNYQRIAQRIRKCKNNPEISQISKLNQILKLLRIDPKLRFPLCHSENLVSYDIFTKYLTKEEINKLEKEIKKGKISSETGIDKKLIKILRLFKEWKLKKNTPSKQKTKKEGEILTEQMQDKEFDKLNKDKKINRYSRIIEDNVRKGILDFCRIAKGLGQIQKKFGISTSSLMENISLLEKEGLIFKTSTNKIGAKNSKDKEIKIKTNLKKLKELETNGFKTPKTKQN